MKLRKKHLTVIASTARLSDISQHILASKNAGNIAPGQTVNDIIIDNHHIPSQSGWGTVYFSEINSDLQFIKDDTRNINAGGTAAVTPLHGAKLYGEANDHQGSHIGTQVQSVAGFRISF
ncbi:hypothetical protein C3432_09180 [Citrobacter amalonaticus]|uniref:Uncharacterized protein n=1 Tax=Citrobacter amalonaticus TaxID=35703 RepID=A0A2S4RZK5_CITAM|nr:hypothetical protein [Citrobacter amalonaticus]POT58084.1 hypothetical protein C3432_09180 [Citrobacter amalonaticus]POT76391.1 hypothetical protein C3436_02645 [Citrobacter amalonaticus]POU66610.1 hypothetical protein C3430_07380 [Citrobacter amalonaticus]POV05626.1 hypothetical protein C3424_09950 [Citrobacter amalonaticus]